MVFGMLSRLARVRVTLGYTAALVAVATALLMLGPHVRDQVIWHTSTNLHNLGDGRIGTLIGSAFVNESGPIYVWLPGLVALLALAELLWRGRRLVVAFVVGHVGATLLVAAGLAVAVGVGLLSMSIVDVTDVGMSYGAVGVLGTLTAAIPQPLARGLDRLVVGGGDRLGGCQRRRLHQYRARDRPGPRHAGGHPVRPPRPLDVGRATACWRWRRRSAT